MSVSRKRIVYDLLKIFLKITDSGTRKKYGHCLHLRSIEAIKTTPKPRQSLLLCQLQVVRQLQNTTSNIFERLYRGLCVNHKVMGAKNRKVKNPYDLVYVTETVFDYVVSKLVLKLSAKHLSQTLYVTSASKWGASGSCTLCSHTSFKKAIS